ncbi:cysteine--tRNA ligase [Humidisolicoccus flavus]|uniref:cysteine--tRNA ligase n=1 Tax=Humidisolicoccus flavus TaxID=3111414 RepID=UPI00324A1439
MTIRMHDSKHASIRDFVPLRDGEVSLYVCGPTVQSAPHIGHIRGALAYDLWRRWFTARGFDVTLVRNVTDIDDKVLAASGSEPWWALAYRIEGEFTAAYRAIGILPPTYEPRATASIPQMIELIERLIERGHAYQALDGSADVYFDIRSWSEYGSLTRQSIDAMEAAGDADPRGKRDARDFALWKAQKPEEPADASWASPWGPGRPGWHIECSAMSRRYLGEAFDIHGGGLDLRFPHHENELAQSSAAGLSFAQYWNHNGLVKVNGEKMSKSTGNFVLAHEVLASARPIVVRYFLAASHYRSVIDFRMGEGGSLDEAASAFGRIESFLERAGGDDAAAGSDQAATFSALPAAFTAALDEDLGTPQAFAVIHETLRAGNAALDGGETARAAEAATSVRAMLRVLGLDPADSAWSGAAGVSKSDGVLGTLVEALLHERANARAARDFAAADRLRDQLTAAGVTLEDTANGTNWSI